MGDEFVAAGGFDRLWGNNKAISACQRSRRTEKETCEEDINHRSNVHSFLLWPNETVILYKGMRGLTRLWAEMT